MLKILINFWHIMRYLASSRVKLQLVRHLLVEQYQHKQLQQYKMELQLYNQYNWINLRLKQVMVRQHLEQVHHQFQLVVMHVKFVVKYFNFVINLLSIDDIILNENHLHARFVLIPVFSFFFLFFLLLLIYFFVVNCL